jgi:hypothetical protein
MAVTGQYSFVTMQKGKLSASVLLEVHIASVQQEGGDITYTFCVERFLGRDGRAWDGEVELVGSPAPRQSGGTGTSLATHSSEVIAQLSGV